LVIEKRMANLYQDRKSPVWQILEHLQRHGSATIKELEELLGVTTNAVRQHLTTLQMDGYVERQRVAGGVGRPHHAYSMTSHAHELFACHCDDLALSLLQEVFDMEGRERTLILLDRVGDRLARKYADSVRSDVLQERVVQLAAELHRQGVLTEVIHPDSSHPNTEHSNREVIVLKAYTCPYHELAQEHPEICEMDEKLIRKVLRADVSLSGCMMEGHNGCSFVIRPQELISIQELSDTPIP
jgi:predicted ArsR family transcriptional regulator